MVLEFYHTEKIKNQIEPKNWNKLLKDKNIKIIDTRKPFEYKVGTFKGAENPNIKNFRDFPKYFKKIKKKNKNSNVLYWRHKM